MRKLVPALLLAACSVAAAGAAEPRPASWLGQKLDPAQTPFCRAYGCEFQGVRHNTQNTMGWHDGTQRTYRLRSGARLQVDLRPAGWISNAFLLFPPQPVAGGLHALAPEHHAPAAEFLSAVTGRRFSAGAVAACQRARLALNTPDAYGPTRPLSRWRTPGGLPFVARCGINSQVGVWAGWMQG
ncbi:hypothetical protein ACFSR9_04010 [Deinococcus taklimakanensis]|uniref:Uncharacterized protein n=1 Tax=Deinococcus taklimakanensis TaxID=536443 RepID=A0ABW5P3B5_9DEIO